MLAHDAAVAGPFGLEIRIEPRGDPPRGAVDHALALDRAAQMLAQVELRRLARVVRGALRAKPGDAPEAQNEGEHRPGPQQNQSCRRHALTRSFHPDPSAGSARSPRA